LKDGLLQEELADIFAAIGAAEQLLRGRQVGRSLQLLKTMLWAFTIGGVVAVRRTAIARTCARIEIVLVVYKRNRDYEVNKRFRLYEIEQR
jgi:hypothetical protein